MFKFEEYPQIKKAHETYEKMSNGSYKAEQKYIRLIFMEQIKDVSD